MKRHLSGTPKTSSPKTPRTEGSNQQSFFFQFEDGCRMVDLRDADGAKVATDQIRDMDALRHLIQQDFPPGLATVVLDKTALLSSVQPSSSSRILAGPQSSSDSRSSLPPSSSSSAPSVLESLPGCAELIVKGLLVCQPVAASLFGALPLSDWMKLRRVARCWRDAVDEHLKSLKELNVYDVIGSPMSTSSRFAGGSPIKKYEQYNRKKIEPLLRFLSKKALAIQSLTVGGWITAFPKFLEKFEKLKHLDMQGARLNPGVLELLEKMKALESMETICLPSELEWTFDPEDPVSEESYENRLELLSGRLNSLQSLTFGLFHPILEHLKHPEKLTTLSIEGYTTYYDDCNLPTLQSLPRFHNLQHLEITFQFGEDPAETAALESALKQLKALKRLGLEQCWHPALQSLDTISSSLPKGMDWARGSQLTRLDLGSVPESFIGCINQITTLNCLWLSPAGKVSFACSLPQLHTLCLGWYCVEGSFFELDFQPACCNIQNLSLSTARGKLRCLVEGLLNRNKNIRKLRIEWRLTSEKSDPLKVKNIANACKNLETLELESWACPAGLSKVLAMFVDKCPMLKNLKTSKYVDELKAMEEFEHLNITELPS